MPARPFADCPPALLRGVQGVLTDIDDTLTTDGAITADALTALFSLRAAGLPVIAVTGRPAGWSEAFARDWPIDAIVAENGAVALWADSGRLRIEHLQDEAERRRNAQRLRDVQAHVVAEIPGAVPARDSAGRLTDIAIDHSEFATLPPADIDAVVALMRAAGMQATVSSIHVNGWFGTHDKWVGAQWIVQRRLGRTLAGETDRWLYVGDSTNDQAMFERFATTSIGVANLRRFEAELRVWPAWISAGERGAGFAEVARALLGARRP